MYGLLEKGFCSKAKIFTFCIKLFREERQRCQERLRCYQSPFCFTDNKFMIYDSITSICLLDTAFTSIYPFIFSTLPANVRNTTLSFISLFFSSDRIVSVQSESNCIVNFCIAKEIIHGTRSRCYYVMLYKLYYT